MCSLMHVCLLILEYIGLTTEHQILSQIAFISFCIVTLYDWSGKLAPLSQPIRSKIKTNCKSLAFLAFYSYCVLTPSSHWLSAVLYLLWLAVEYQDVILFFFFLFTSLLSEFHCLSIGAKPSGAVLGEVVMEGNVVVFDRANQRIGFAPSNMSHPDVGQCGKRGPGKGFYWYGSVILVGCSRLLQPAAN